MLKNLIKWLFESQKQFDELNNKLDALGIDITPMASTRDDFTNYGNALRIILDGMDLSDEFDDERIMEDFWYGTDFEAFWAEYGEVFET